MNERSSGSDPWREVAATAAPLQTRPQSTALPGYEAVPTPVPPYAPVPPQAPLEAAKPKRRRVWVFVLLGMAVTLAAGAAAGTALAAKAHREAAAARAGFAAAERDFATAYNGWLATSLDTDLDWDETLAANDDHVADMDEAVSDMEKSATSLPDDAEGVGSRIVDAAKALEVDVREVQASLRDFGDSDVVDYDLGPLADQADRLSEATAELNGLVADWAALDAVREAEGKTAAGLEMSELEDSWADVLGMAEATIQDRQDALLSDFIAAFDESADSFVESAVRFTDTLNGLINANPAGIPAATRPMLDGMSRSVAAMQELTTDLDADTSPVRVTEAAATVLDLSHKAVAASTGDAATFNSVSAELDAALKDLQAALEEYDAAVMQLEESAGA